MVDSSYLTSCAWILLTGKTRASYIEAISWVGRCLPFGNEPNASFVGVDFESAFISLINIVFSDAFLVGCFFHFKQAIRRRMKKLGIHYVVMEVILLVLDYAPSLPLDEMIIKGVPYLKFLVRGYLKKKKCRSKINKQTRRLYWRYFEE